MPPIQASLRGSLLTGASAFALSLSANGSQAQALPPQAGSSAASPLTFWVEGALAATGGGSFNAVSLLPATSYLSFKAPTGFDGAFGFDYRWPNQAWHFVFDFRYGRSKSSSADRSFFSSFISHPTPAKTVVLTNTGTSHGTERETHLVTDFMVGRDFGIGGGTNQLQFGLRIADLTAKANVFETGKHSFYSSFASPSVVVVGQSASAVLRSRYFGMGPRQAITGAMPIFGPWSFDYSGGVAELFGIRSFDTSVAGAGPPFFINQSSTAFVFNADGYLALTYSFTPTFKLSSGIRGDFYNAVLSTYNVNTGALQNVDRLFWGPFIRLTGAF